MAIVADLSDVEVVREPIEQRGRHLRITQHVRPFCKEEAGRDYGEVIVEIREKMKEQRTVRLADRQISDLVG